MPHRLKIQQNRNITLHRATREGDLNTVEQLIEKEGADLNLALYYAITYDREKIALLLIGKGAVLRIKDYFNKDNNPSDTDLKGESDLDKTEEESESPDQNNLSDMSDFIDNSDAHITFTDNKKMHSDTVDKSSNRSYGADKIAKNLSNELNEFIKLGRNVLVEFFIGYLKLIEFFKELARQEISCEDVIKYGIKLGVDYTEEADNVYNKDQDNSARAQPKLYDTTFTTFDQYHLAGSCLSLTI